MDDRVNILGFSIFNQSHAFFREFAQSLNQSWQENCDHVPFRGPAVGATRAPPGAWAPSVGNQEINPPGACLLRAQREVVLGKSAVCHQHAEGEAWDRVLRGECGKECREPPRPHS